MKQKEIEDMSISISDNSIEIDNPDKDDCSIPPDTQTFTEGDFDKLYTPKLKPLTMKNNCVNLKCMDNIQKLWALREKYQELEKTYFTLENSRAKKCEEFEILLKKKEEEKASLESMTNIYQNHAIKDLDYFKLKKLEVKILKSLEAIQARKEILYQQSSKASHPNKKACVICYENEIKILIKPCNHLCVCTNCSNKIGACPMCREGITSKELIKYS